MVERVSVERLRIADGARGLRHVFVRDLELAARIGVHGHERGQPQPIRINVDLTADDVGRPGGDRLAEVVDYEKVVDAIRAIIARGHVNLVETLAEDIAAACLTDARVAVARVRVEKLAAIRGAQSVGVEIERYRQGTKAGGGSTD